MEAAPGSAARTFLAGLLLGCLLAACTPQAGPEPADDGTGEGPILRRVLHRPFDEVVLTVKSAIGGQNYRITGQNDIGGGLRKRGYSDFPNYVVIHFCSLEAARRGLLIDMRLGAIMPCRIVVYQDGEDVVVLLPRARTVLAPLDNPELAGFQAELERVYAAILEEIAY